MLTEICDYLKNWFELEEIYGKFSVVNGVLKGPSAFDPQEGQYYRVIGSVFNDGVHKWPDDQLTDERPFDGGAWLMAVPPELVALADEIATWVADNMAPGSEAMSPFMSESFADYSYSKGYSSQGGNGSGQTGWASVYASRLMRWKKL